MKVPNKVLNAIVKIVNSIENTGAAGVSADEINTVKMWAADGVIKRAVLAAQANPAEKAAETFGSLEK